MTLRKLIDEELKKVDKDYANLFISMNRKFENFNQTVDNNAIKTVPGKENERLKFHTNDLKLINSALSKLLEKSSKLGHGEKFNFGTFEEVIERYNKGETIWAKE